MEQVTNWTKRKWLQVKGREYEIWFNKTGFDDFIKRIAYYQPFSNFPIPNSYCKSGVVARGSKHVFVHNVWKKHTRKKIGNLISQFDKFIFKFSLVNKEGESEEEKFTLMDGNFTRCYLASMHTEKRHMYMMELRIVIKILASQNWYNLSQESQHSQLFNLPQQEFNISPSYY